MRKLIGLALVAGMAAALSAAAVPAASTSKIVYHSKLRGNNEILVVGSAGGKPTRLTRSTASDSNPRRAQLIANAFAKTFIQYQRTRLAPLTNVSVSLADAAPLPKSPDRP